jgi:type VI secretion system protein ImpI
VATAFVLTAFKVGNQPLDVPRSRFTGLPIRIGRNTLNDFAVNHPTISSFHARIEDVDGRLCAVDLGSKNGVHVQRPGSAVPQRLNPQEPVDLAPSGFQFLLGPHIHIYIAFDEIRDELESRGPGSFAGSVLGNRGMLLETPGSGHRAPSGQPPRAGGALPSLPPLVGSGPPPGGHAQPPAQAYPQAPGAPQESWPMAEVPSQGRRRSSASTEFFNNLGPESLALQGLRELASSLASGATLDTTGDVARFITKLHDALDVFCRSFIPLREGYSQFISSFDLQRNAYHRNNQRSAAYAAIEEATTPEAVAMALLNPRDRSFDAPQAVEGIFADLMLHQLALLEGVMRGVRALLEELSPENIANQAGSHLPLGRYKAIWETYTRRFEDLYEERQTFAYIFGPEFTAAYRQYRQKRPEGE